MPPAENLHRILPCRKVSPSNVDFRFLVLTECASILSLLADRSGTNGGRVPVESAAIVERRKSPCHKVELPLLFQPGDKSAEEEQNEASKHAGDAG
jgi:hypothetical protein